MGKESQKMEVTAHKIWGGQSTKKRSEGKEGGNFRSICKKEERGFQLMLIGKAKGKKSVEGRKTIEKASWLKASAAPGDRDKLLARRT